MRNTIFALIIAALAATHNVAFAASEQVVNVYSARQENLIKPLLDKFTQSTGIKVNLVTGKADNLLARLQLEGERSPADLLITTDAGRLHRAKAANLLNCDAMPALEKQVPARYRDRDGCWYGLSLRARTIMVVKDKVAPSEAPVTYESLAEPRWRGKICVRSSGNIYNQSLVASMLANRGARATLQWLEGLRANFARPPSGGDRDQILAAAGGLCDIVIANTYYLAMMLVSDDQQQAQAAAKMLVTWPNQAGRGTHVNVSGAGVVRSAPHAANAYRLLAYLAGDAAQAWYADANHEYPIRADVATPALLRAWGDFSADALNLSRLGELNVEAVKLMDQAGWR